MEAYSAPVGYVFSLNAGGRSGTFDVVAGDFSTELAADALNGIYVGLSDDPTATTKVAKRRYSVHASIEWFGAIGDDTTDNRASVQAALDLCNSVIFPEGKFKINAVIGVLIPSNRDLYFSAGSELKVIPTAQSDYQIFLVEFVENITFFGPHLSGDKFSHLSPPPATGGGNGHGINMLASKNVKIFGGIAEKFWGDGLYIGAFDRATHYECEDIVVKDFVSTNNRRQGLSITGVHGMVVDSCVFSFTQGTAPEAGIDIEPNIIFTAKDILVTNCRIYGNAGSGIDLNAVSGHTDLDKNTYRTMISNCHIYQNKFGINSFNSIETLISDCVIRNNRANGLVCSGLYSDISISDSILRDNAGAITCSESSLLRVNNCVLKGYGVYVRSKAIITNTTISDCVRAITSTSSSTASGNVTIDNCEITGCGREALFASSDSGLVTLRNSIITGNAADLSTSQIAIFGGEFRASNNTVRKGNTLPTYGLNLGESCVPTVVNNDFRDSGTGNILIDSNSASRVIENNFPYNKRGPFANRPSNNVMEGDTYLSTDTPNQILIYYSGSNIWKDGAGNTYP
jgi:hypothetical protein